MPFSSVFPNPHRSREALDEQHAQRFIDTLLHYRRKEVLQALVAGWCVFLLMVFSLIFTVRLAFHLTL